MNTPDSGFRCHGQNRPEQRLHWIASLPAYSPATYISMEAVTNDVVSCLSTYIRTWPETAMLPWPRFTMKNWSVKTIVHE